MENNFFPSPDEQQFLSSFLNPDEAEKSSSEDKIPGKSPLGPTLSLYFIELVNRIKASLAAMKAFAFLSREQFKDLDVGDQFYKIVNEDIEKTLSLLNCFGDYLNFNTPLIKKNTIHILIEAVLKKHEHQLGEKKIKLIKKQFEKDLPETIVPDEQLKYIFNSVIDYTLLSVPPGGSIGFLTRLFDLQTLTREEKDQLSKDGKYIEILIVSSSQGKSESAEVIPGTAATRPEEAMNLILKLVMEIIKKNKGLMKFKVYQEKPMTFISLILPIERRNVVHYPSPEERLKKVMGVEK